MVDIKIYRPYTIEVVRRELYAEPGNAEPHESYTRVFGTRADVKSKGGQSEFAQVSIKGQQVTHTFAFRFTRIPFDVRDRIRDARGQMWQILAIENVDLADRELRVQCASVGSETVEAAR